MTAIPSPLVEASNGTLLILLMWMILFATHYLCVQWRKFGRLSLTHDNCQAAIALLALLVGFELRTFPLWMFRHMQNQGIEPAAIYREIGVLLFIIGTVAAVWGGMCWIKVITPLECSPRAWWFMTSSAVAFGIFMAL